MENIYLLAAEHETQKGSLMGRDKLFAPTQSKYILRPETVSSCGPHDCFFPPVYARSHSSTCLSYPHRWRVYSCYGALHTIQYIDSGDGKFLWLCESNVSACRAVFCCATFSLTDSMITGKTKSAFSGLLDVNAPAEQV